MAFPGFLVNIEGKPDENGEFAEEDKSEICTLSVINYSNTPP